MNLDELISNEEESSIGVRFDEYISSRKCPFRMNADGEMEYCDPCCMALICAEGYAYSCLRLVHINHEAPKIVYMKSNI